MKNFLSLIFLFSFMLGRGQGPPPPPKPNVSQSYISDLGGRSFAKCIGNNKFEITFENRLICIPNCNYSDSFYLEYTIGSNKVYKKVGTQAVKNDLYYGYDYDKKPLTCPGFSGYPIYEYANNRTKIVKDTLDLNHEAFSHISKNNCKIRIRNILIDSVIPIFFEDFKYHNMAFSNSDFKNLNSYLLEINYCHNWKEGEYIGHLYYDRNMQFIPFFNIQEGYLNSISNPGDSIVYVFHNPLNNELQNKTYSNNYTFRFPIEVFCQNTAPCSPNPRSSPPRGFFLDSLTGRYVFYPISYSGRLQNMLNFGVKTFRKDSNNLYKEVSYSTLHYTALMGLPQPGTSPYNPGIISAKDTFTICEYDSFQTEFLTFKPTDTSYLNNDSLILNTWTNITNLNTEIINKDSSFPKIRVSLLPDSTMELFKYYKLIISAWDKKPLWAQNFTKTFYINVVPKISPILTIDSSSLCGKYKINFSSENGNNFNIEWSVSPLLSPENKILNSKNLTDSFSLLDKGFYIIKYNCFYNSDCKNEFSDTIFLGNSIVLSNTIQNPQTPICKGDSLRLHSVHNKPMDSIFYLWYSSNDTLGTNSFLNIVSNEKQTVFLKSTNQNNCISLDSFSINPFSKPAIDLINDTAICYNDSIKLSPTITWNDIKSKLVWNHSNTVNYDSVLIAKEEGFYILKVENTNGCISSDSIYIKRNPMFSSLSENTSTCQGSSLSIQGFSVAAYDSAEWKWGPVSNPDGFDSVYTWTYFSNLVVPHQFRYKLNGIWCSQSHNFFVVALPKPKPNFTLSDTALCLRNNLFTATDLSPAAAARTWINPDGASSSDSLYQFSLQNHGSFSLGLALVNAQGCSDTLFKPLRTLPNPVAFANILQQRPCFADNFVEVDFGASIASGSVASRSILWGNGKSNSISPASQIYSAPGSYNAMVIATSNRACTDTLLVPLQVLPAPSPSLRVLKACENDSLVLLSSNPHSQENTHFLYLNQVLVDSASLSPNQSHTWYGNIGSSPMQAKLIARSSQGCTDSISLSISPNPSPRASIQAVLLRDQKLAYRFTGSGSGSIAQWQWFSSQGNSGSGQVWEPRFNDTGMTTITLRVSSPQGCSSDTSIVVPVYDKITLFVPNAFSPNADGINDTWKVGGMLLFQDFSIKVFNRWGQQVWQATKATDEWNGEGAINGAYLYILSARDILGQLHELQGMLYLER
jgi:gliding motility-associated-like protein